MWNVLWPIWLTLLMTCSLWPGDEVTEGSGNRRPVSGSSRVKLHALLMVTTQP